MLLRAPTPVDADAVLAVVTAREIADFGALDRAHDVRDEWRRSEFDLAADATVVEIDGAIVAYAALRDIGAQAVVAPAHEGAGIGGRLLAWVEQRARERGREVHRQWIAASNERAAALLRAAGYTRERSYWRMVRALDRPAGSVALPAGCSVRTPELERDGAALHALDDASFAAVPDYHPHSFMAFADEHLHAPDLDLDLSAVIERDDELVGFLLARRWRAERIAYVDLLGVHPNHQRQGLGSALLLTAFARAGAAGLGELQLVVASDNPNALTLYERLGMRAGFQVDAYVRPIGADA
jgi:mycothiol synthase